MGRPKAAVQLTEVQIQSLAAIGCTDNEIATLAGVSEPTLQRRFDTALKAGRASLRESLRKAQVQRALNGSDTMLIWLGKQYLGQRDKQEITGDGVPIQVKTYVTVSPDDWKAPDPTSDTDSSV